MMAFSEILARRRVELPQEEMPDKCKVQALKRASRVTCRQMDPLCWSLPSHTATMRRAAVDEPSRWERNWECA